MSKFDKITKIIKIGSGVAKPFVPGSIGDLLDVVNKGLADETDPANEKVLKEMAKVNDAQTEAIIAISTRQDALEARVKKLEGR
jgi:hypothetical protein